MTALATALQTKLAKLPGMLGSDHAGGRDAAGLAAHRFIRDRGMTWESLLLGPVWHRRCRKPQRSGDMARDCSQLPAPAWLSAAVGGGFLAQPAQLRPPFSQAKIGARFDRRPRFGAEDGGMSASSTTVRGFIVEDYVARRANSLRGFVRVTLPSGMVLHDVGVHVNAGRAWAMPSSKDMLDRAGTAARDDHGKIRYLPVVGFTIKELRDKFSDAVIEAVRQAYPDVLADAS
jgi:hypothetical protein